MFKRKSIYFIVLLICCFLLLKTQPQIMSQNLKNTETSSLKQSQSVKVKPNLETWVGEYSFYEYAPPDQNLSYSIVIYKKDNKYYAKIVGDGFQTMHRLLAIVMGDANSIKLKFVKYLPDNMFEPYKKGDILISFEKKDSKLITTWGEIPPLSVKDKKTGEYFKIDHSIKNPK